VVDVFVNDNIFITSHAQLMR